MSLSPFGNNFSAYLYMIYTAYETISHLVALKRAEYCADKTKFYSNSVIKALG